MFFALTLCGFQLQFWSAREPFKAIIFTVHPSAVYFLSQNNQGKLQWNESIQQMKLSNFLALEWDYIQNRIVIDYFPSPIR